MEFKAVDENVNRQSVSYRFGLLKNRMHLVHSRLNEISTMVKLKNPSLLQSLHKPPKETLNPTTANNSMKRTLGFSSGMGSTARQHRP